MGGGRTGALNFQALLNNADNFELEEIGAKKYKGRS
ncbi:hypothetical protein BuS5_00301 [Desulfosarcina sp. BuS5]|nr:hypothetical protein BuS5_00301 [Desulfosarcina sp. BuS5]